MQNNAKVCQPLATSSEIRILELLPGAPSSRICGSLKHVDLEDKQHPPYECLSYTWGDELDEESIDLCGEEIGVRRNLFNFLRRLRAGIETPRLFWVDALCINQSDLAEKGRQVQMIGRIFMEADRVLAWIGEHADGSEAIFEPWPRHPRRRERLRTAASLRERIAVAARKFDDETRQARLDTWSAFFNRPYWTRTWIVQELVLAKSVVLYCGSSVADWMQLILSRLRWGRFDVTSRMFWLSDAVLRFDGLRVSSFPQELRRALRYQYLLIRARTAKPRFEKYDGFLAVLEATSLAHFRFFGTISGLGTQYDATKCRDPRDRIYAVLWLEPQESPLRKRLVAHGWLPAREPTPVDYEADLSGVFVQVCRARITSKSSGFDIVWVGHLLDCLGIDEKQTQPIVDFLLDEVDSRKFSERGNFWAIAGALYLRNMEPGNHATSKLHRWAMLVSIRSLRSIFAQGRETQRSAGQWHDSERPPVAFTEPSENNLAIDCSGSSPNLD